MNTSEKMEPKISNDNFTTHARILIDLYFNASETNIVKRK